MALRVLSLLLLLGCACAAPTSTNDEEDVKNVAPKDADSGDLKTAASSTHARRYSDYGVTGYGLLDQGYNSGYNSVGYSSAYYPSYSTYSGYKGYSGYGGYGGYGGNGGLNSYYGYNNPYYSGSNHLGYGYQRPGYYQGIYNGAITPSLVTGYRGYTRR